MMDPALTRYLTRILIVEPDADVRALLCEYFESRRIAQVQAAHDGMSALSIHLRQPCDVALASTALPDVGTTRLIAGLAAIGRPRIVLLSDSTDAQELLGALRAGAADVFVKPLRLDELGAVVERMIGLRRRRVLERRRQRRFAEELRRLRRANRALEARLELVSRDLVEAYGRLARRAARLAGARPE